MDTTYVDDVLGVSGRDFVLGKSEWYPLLRWDITRRCEEVPVNFCGLVPSFGRNNLCIVVVGE